jgi:serine/threonine-protein kinase
MDSMDKYIGRMLDNRYEILEKIGVGGMAVVYKARCHRLNRFVAIKVLKDELAVDDDFRRRFHTESQAVAMLSHPNIVTVYDVSRNSEIEYIVMELIEGITLKQYLIKRGILSWKEALHFSSQITKALIHAHSRGIIHRDIKPHNIMILRDSSVKVADFGIARLPTTQNTLTQETLGSVHYISPEQAKGGRVDSRADIYSLGVVMYEMITGRLPFEGENAISVAIQHFSSIPLMPREINPEIPAGFENITMRAMNPKLEQRYQSAEKLYEDLESFRKNPEYKFDYSDLDFKAVDKEIDDNNPSRDRGKGGSSRYNTDSIAPISRKGELTRDEYIKNKRKAKNVAIFSGTFLVIVFIIAVFLYLWKSWFGDMFVEPETMQVPDFVGLNIEDVINNPTYTDYFDIIPTRETNDTVENNYIFKQSPAAGRTVIKSEDKPDIQVSVSSGSTTIVMPDVVNKDYRTATIELEKLKLVVAEPEMVTSKDVTKGYVISTVPSAGEELQPGTTVYITVSNGPEITYVTMPDLSGKNIDVAKAQLEALNLVLGTVTAVSDQAEKNTVIFQSTTAGTSIPEHTKINLNISSGPEETAQPSDDGTEVEPPEVSDNPEGTANGNNG